MTARNPVPTTVRSMTTTDEKRDGETVPHIAPANKQRGFSLAISSRRMGTKLLTAEGVTIRGRTRSNEVELRVYGSLRDCDYDHVLLLTATLVPAKTTWFGNGVDFEGVLTDLRYRSEEETAAEAVENRTGLPGFAPKTGPVLEDRHWGTTMAGRPWPMLEVCVRAWIPDVSATSDVEESGGHVATDATGGPDTKEETSG